MNDQITWNENKVLMKALWPDWSPAPELASLLNERWFHFRQEKLRDCIKDNKLKSQREPNIAAIHKEYCRITGQESTQVAASREVERTRMDRQQCHPLSPEELSEWDSWAEEVLSTATAAERKAVTERLGIAPASPRVLAIAVDYIRRNHAAR